MAAHHSALVCNAYNVFLLHGYLWSILRDLDEAAMKAVLPIVIFFFAQRMFIQGIVIIGMEK